MVRAFRPEEKDVYIALCREFYHSDAVLHPLPESHYERTWQELQRSDAYAVAYALEWEGEVAGYVLLARTFSQEAGGMVVWLDEMYVRPAFRSRGLGAECFAFVEREFAGAARLRLEVEPDNRRAKALYARLGYRPLPYEQMIKGE